MVSQGSSVSVNEVVELHHLVEFWAVCHSPSNDEIQIQKGFGVCVFAKGGGGEIPMGLVKVWNTLRIIQHTPKGTYPRPPTSSL